MHHLLGGRIGIRGLLGSDKLTLLTLNPARHASTSPTMAMEVALLVFHHIPHDSFNYALLFYSTGTGRRVRRGFNSGVLRYLTDKGYKWTGVQLDLLAGALAVSNAVGCLNINLFVLEDYVNTFKRPKRAP